jgi:hypothetical protein
MSEESRTLVSLVKDYGTLIIAIYGVVQIWIIALWRKYIKRGKLEIFPSGFIEIGYSAFGPTIGLNGTLRAVDKDVFVSSMRLELTRVKDGLSHAFEWMAFRSTQIHFRDPKQITLELAAGFIVPVNQPYRYQIVFNDRQTMSEIEPALIKVKLAWQQFFQNAEDIVNKAISSGIPATNVLSNLYSNDFRKESKENHEAWDVLERKNYWEPGTYKLRMVVVTSGPNQIFSKDWSFELDKRSTHNLRLNSIAVLQELCAGQVNYQFAYPPYISADQQQGGKV